MRAHGQLQRALAGIVQGAVLADGAGGQAGVGRAAGLLHGAGQEDALADGRRGFGLCFAAKLLKRHSGHFHLDIDAVEQRAADLAEVLLDLGGRAAAFARGVAIEAAAAPVQISTAREHEGRVLRNSAIRGARSQADSVMVPAE